MLFAFKKRYDSDISVSEFLILVTVLSFVFFTGFSCATYQAYCNGPYYYPTTAKITRFFPQMHNTEEIQYQVSGVQYSGTLTRNVDYSTINPTADIFYDIRNPAEYGGDPHAQFQSFGIGAVIWLLITVASSILPLFNLIKWIRKIWLHSPT